jgi:hypothetical protein
MLLNLLDGPTKGDFGRKEISKESLTDGLVVPTSILLTFFFPSSSLNSRFQRSVPSPQTLKALIY